ncbi:photosystem II reaction center protein Ycf12 [bacterium]|nr:photosystem II reaction center protein Ycf12 [bacterium]NBX78224.1 photosystem II reaction center protein Ycf12 [bacterium]
MFVQIHLYVFFQIKIITILIILSLGPSIIFLLEYKKGGC